MKSKQKQVSKETKLDDQEYLEELSKIPKKIKALYMYHYGALEHDFEHDAVVPMEKFFDILINCPWPNSIKVADIRYSNLTFQKEWVRYTLTDTHFVYVEPLCYAQEANNLEDLITEGEIVDWFMINLPAQDWEEALNDLRVAKLTGNYRFKGTRKTGDK